jgi:translation initiation factor IF-2
MAKLRVHELAKKLKVSSKVLMDRLTALSIPFKSSLSALEDEDVERVMEALDQTPKSNKTVVVKKRQVLRKRPSTAEPEEKGEVVSEAPAVVAPTPDIAQVPEEQAIQDAEAKVEAIKALVEEKCPETKAETVIEEDHVRMESPPAIEPPAAQPEEDQTLPVSAAPDVVDLSIPEPDEHLLQEAPKEVPVESQTVVEEKEADRTIEQSQESAEVMVNSTMSGQLIESEPLPGPEPEASAELKAEKAGKKKKKNKKDMPAKIIKLPSIQVPVAAEPAGPKGAPDRREVQAAVAPPIREEKVVKPVTTTEEAAEAAEKDRKKKKRAKEIEEEIEERKVPKKKAGFKKKEVVESADLYAGGDRQRKAGKKGKQQKTLPQQQKTLITTPKAIKRRIKIDDTIILSDLAKRMGVKGSDLIVKLMGLGVMATVNQAIDYDTAVLVATEFGYEVERAAFEEESLIRSEEIDPSKMTHRPPVVTIMGHVDHGKTSLLDVIRKTHVTEAEAGGITQHIGAYHVTTERGQIVFLDTPGHEAFTAMRSRGAGITDIVVLVVAADDGVMPQTIEAINHARAANVPIIVAVNKIDKPGADPERVQRGLSDVGLVPEQWGGDTIFVKVSAKTKQGIDELLDMILLQAEVLDLKADASRLAYGHVIEAKLDAGRGPVATVLVQQGTLKTGDPVVCGVHYGKLRALLDDRGQHVDFAGPSMPVEVIGLSGVPVAGDEIIALADEKDARNVSAHRLQKQRAKELAKTNRVSLDKLFEKMKEGEVKDLNLILKADVQGSIEALTDALVKLSNEEVNIRVIHAGTGAITESDISLATVSNAIILGFNIRPSAKIQAMASEEHVDMRFYNIIYNLIKDVKDAIVGMMKSTFEERMLGRAEVREVYNIPKVGAIAGCYVQDGKIQRGKSIRVVRDGIVVYEGKIGSLKRFKDDAKEVLAGYECGVGIENFNDIKQNDILECFYLEELRPEIESEGAR